MQNKKPHRHQIHSFYYYVRLLLKSFCRRKSSSKKLRTFTPVIVYKKHRGFETSPVSYFFANFYQCCSLFVSYFFRKKTIVCFLFFSAQIMFLLSYTTDMDTEKLDFNELILTPTASLCIWRVRQSFLVFADKNGSILCTMHYIRISTIFCFL